VNDTLDGHLNDAVLVNDLVLVNDTVLVDNLLDGHLKYRQVSEVSYIKRTGQQRAAGRRSSRRRRRRRSSSLRMEPLLKFFCFGANV
jgi:hypothetical protein